MTATPISSMVLVLFASIVGSFGAVFLKLGAVRLTDVWSLLNWRLLLGVGLYLGLFGVLRLGHQKRPDLGAVSDGFSRLRLDHGLGSLVL